MTKRLLGFLLGSGKALAGGVGAALLVSGPFAIDQAISLQEAIYITSAFVSSFNVIYWVPNRKTD